MTCRILCILVLAAAASIPAWSQQALVVELTKEEAAKASELHRRLTAAQAEWEAFRTGIRDKYGPVLSTLVPSNRRVAFMTPGGPQIHGPMRWMDGIVFSNDFRFAMPRQQEQ